MDRIPESNEMKHFKFLAIMLELLLRGIYAFGLKNDIYYFIDSKTNYLTGSIAIKEAPKNKLILFDGHFKNSDTAELYTFRAFPSGHERTSIYKQDFEKLPAKIQQEVELLKSVLGKP